MKLTSSNVWFTSDTHYDHGNICLGTTNWDTSTKRGLDAVRNFPDLRTMNYALVNGINSVVGQDDYLIHLGDWSFGGFEKIEEFRSKIICNNVILMIGNHDHHIERNKENVKSLFTKVTHYEELVITNSVKSTSENFVLCHYPITSWNRQRKGSMMLHGHQHLKGQDRFGEGKRMDVGICGSPEFRPYHLDEVLKIMKKRESLGHH